MKTRLLEAQDAKFDVLKTGFVQVANIFGQSWVDLKLRLIYDNKEVVFNTENKITKFRIFLLKLLFGNLISVEDKKQKK
jgi:hypothetical protein